MQVLPAKPAAAPTAAADDDDDDDSDDDDDIDLFGELTPEEQAAQDEKKRVIEEAKARGAAKAKLTKSMVVLEVKPWDDETGQSHMSSLLSQCHEVSVSVSQFHEA